MVEATEFKQGEKITEKHIELALQLVLKQHKDQKDKVGKPYFLHPIRVGFKFNHPFLVTLGLLHDLVEDTRVNLSDIRFMFGGEMEGCVDYLTHDKGDSYAFYIDGVMADYRCMQIKLADLEDNMAIFRLCAKTEKDLKRMNKYQRTYKKIQGSMV